MKNNNKNQSSNPNPDLDLNLEEKISFVDPKKILKMAGVKSNDKVADFGCGAGYFSIPAAVIVGEGGEVHCFDVLPSAIEAIESHARINGVDNVTIKRANLEAEKSTGLPDESIDWVIIKDILFQNKGKQKILKEAKRILKSGGNVLVMEWNNNLSMGPEKKKRIGNKDMLDMIFKEDFVYKKQSDAGDYHYVIIATKI